MAVGLDGANRVVESDTTTLNSDPHLRAASSSAFDLPEYPTRPRERASARSCTTVQSTSGLAEAGDETVGEGASFDGDGFGVARVAEAEGPCDPGEGRGSAERVAFSRRFSSSVTWAWDEAAVASLRPALFFQRSAFASARSSLARNFLTVALSFFSLDEGIFFADMGSRFRR